MTKLKLKQRPKVRRRGQRLIVEFGSDRMVLLSQNGQRRVIEFSLPGECWQVTYSPCGRYAMRTGTRNGKAMQFAHGDHIFTRSVAFRDVDANSLWGFRDPADPESDKPLISASDAGIVNAALLASLVVATIDGALAEWLGVSRALCRADAIEAIHDNPRFKALRDFKFKLTPPAQWLGSDRRAANRIRHEHSNWDEMLQAAGGLLWPEQYEQVRKGVDALVRPLLEDGK